MENISTSLRNAVTSSERQRKNSVRIFISKDLKLGKRKKSIIVHFVKYVDRALCLQSNYNIFFVSERRKFGIETTGLFLDNNALIYCKNRLLVDVLRSTAHELVHAKLEEERMGDEDNFTHFNNPDEDRANLLSGEILNAYTEVVGHWIYEV